ncbi:MAG TPA: hypothetical protein P5116_06960 [Eubacteriales bacterium]|nr:hypothetical protein [Clostridia bacterium]HRV73595.1 hypothetical protein [Eubacteriales bacterium]
MDIQFDRSKHKRGDDRQTRIYNPGKAEPIVNVDFDDQQLPLVRPQPTGKQTVVKPVEREHSRSEFMSRLLIILSVFLMAGTALLALWGNVELTDIYSSINDIQEDIDSTKEDISLLKKQQSQYDDYNSINETNIESGRTRLWIEVDE